MPRKLSRKSLARLPSGTQFIDFGDYGRGGPCTNFNVAAWRPRPWVGFGRKSRDNLSENLWPDCRQLHSLLISVIIAEGAWRKFHIQQEIQPPSARLPLEGSISKNTTRYQKPWGGRVLYCERMPVGVLIFAITVEAYGIFRSSPFGLEICLRG